MLIFITIISILLITLAVWIINKILPFRVCPICAGVSLTWLWLIAACFFGYHIDLLIPAILMGGSVVGIAYQIEKRLALPNTQLLWKTLFVSVGFIAVYGVLTRSWSISLASFIFLLLTTYIFLSSFVAQSGQNEMIEKLEEKMKDCC